MKECEACGEPLDYSTYVAPWEDGDNEYGYWVCKRCKHKTTDWDSGDE